MMKLGFFAVVVGLAACLPAAERYEPFDEGERIVCVGDSITHGGMYPYYLQLAQLLRHPGSTARVMNAGHSGGTCDGALGRWSWDIKPMKGTLTFLMFGMNDVNHNLYMPDAAADTIDADRRKAIDGYAANERKMSEDILATGSKLILVTPTPYDEYGTWQQTEARVGCNEIGLAACAEEVRKLAAEKRLPVVELHRPLTEALKRNHEGFKLADRIHPDPKGHLAMLRGFLKALNVSSEIAAATVSADGKVLETRHAEVDQVKLGEDTLSFRYSPKAMPFPDFPAWHEPLRVTELAAGTWELIADGVTLGEFTAEKFAQGIDLARLETPTMAQARKALARMGKWRNLDSSRRNLVKIEIQAQRLGADPQDYEASCKAIDYWYERHISKGASAGYYRRLIDNYKDNATNRSALASSIQVQLDETIRLAQPRPYSVVLRKLADEVPASAWISKFYVGLEANGDMSVDPQGYRGKSPSVELRYIHGATKFGAEAPAKTELKGPVNWRVTAELKCAPEGEAGVAMEFFDEKGASLGVQTGAGFKDAEWTQHEWRFNGPAKATSASVHVLSLARGPVSFAKVRLYSVQGKAEDGIALQAYALPSKWNTAWNGGREETTSFADAPLPLTFHFKGERNRLKRPLVRIEYPAELELTDAFCTHADHYAVEKPIVESDVVRDGIAYHRIRFEDIMAFRILRQDYGWERKLAIVLAPTNGLAGAGRNHRIYWHVADGEVRGGSGCVMLKYAALPTGLREPKSFYVFTWQTNDRLYSNDRSLDAAVKALEMAGMTTFVRTSSSNARAHEIVERLSKRTAPWRFTLTFSDSWDKRFLEPDSDSFKALDVRMAERNDGKKMDTPLLCPDYFLNDPAFHAHYRDNVILPRLRDTGIKAGDMVSGDLEPWGARYFCTCRHCLEAFAKFANLSGVPGPRDVLRMPDQWAAFRCHQTEMSVAKLAKIVRDYNPGIKVIDYDYVIWYGTDSEKSFSRGCSKNAAMDDKWLDGHICSYYHICDKTAFDAIRNNTRKLEKPYIPLGAIEGAGSYLRDGEVRNPAQIRQLALAAAVHGCPGIGFYKGLHLDGEHLLALMKARDEIAAVENYPWGRKEGALVADSSNQNFAWATSEGEGRQIVSLFNYDGKDALKAKLTAPRGGKFTAVDPVSGKVIAERADLGGGLEIEVAPYDVRFVELRK